MAAADYIAMAGAGDLYEKASSEMLVRDTGNADVRRFAQMMIADHAKTTAQVKSAAQAAHVTVPPPALTVEQQSMIDALRASHTKNAGPTILVVAPDHAPLVATRPVGGD